MHAFPHSNIAQIMIHLAFDNPRGSGEIWYLAALPVPGKTWLSLCIYLVGTVFCLNCLQ